MATSKGTKGKGLSPQALREFRSSVAQLKRKGIVSNRVDARKQKPTRYMMSKVRKMQDVLGPNATAIAVKAPKNIRDQYTSKGLLEERGSFLIAPKEYANQRARLKRGMVQVIRPLRNGTEEYIILPWKANDLRDLVEQMKTDPDALDNMKEADEYLSFRLFGHNAGEMFPDTADLIAGLEYYLPRLGTRDDVVKHITFQRYRGDLDDDGRNPIQGKEPKVAYNSNVAKDKGPKGSWELARDKRRAAKQARYVAALPPEVRAARAERRKLAERARRAKYRKEKGK